MTVTALAVKSAEVVEWAKFKGWYDGEQPSFLACMSLLHSEVSEALEAWRDWGLKDATGSAVVTVSAKPEGAPSELADVFIRLLDDCVRFEVDLAEQAARTPFPGLAFLLAEVERDDRTFPDCLAVLHLTISNATLPWLVGDESWRWVLPGVYWVLVAICERFGIDLEAEYARKMAYNHTRAYRHGGRAF